MAHIIYSQYMCTNTMHPLVNYQTLSVEKSLVETRIIFLSTPPVNEEQMKEVLKLDNRTNEQCKRYSDACVELCQKMGINVIDLNTVFKQQEDWEAKSFTDGIHLSAFGSDIVIKQIRKAITEANWGPSLHWDSLPSDFGDILSQGTTWINDRKPLIWAWLQCSTTVPYGVAWFGEGHGSTRAILGVSKGGYPTKIQPEPELEPAIPRMKEPEPVAPL
ncbi:hypothetical protein OSB04_021172 [Centaurea solstitialis]|uniref:SGNH hydrolase-type esterase domain-containing protein n=1 Tax=Centaurea solstitialis TaxID=347529 RepID=A0AA38WFZ7_9ASTR|nr:hypothetical protein OSB04_021172 [Centaurea solstitialis]